MTEHKDEELNSRSLYLRMLKKIWIVPAAVIVCAAIFGAFYLLLTQVIHDTRQYQKVSKLYIEFAYDEHGTVYDYYNGATWTDLLVSDPQLSDAILEEMPAGIGHEEGLSLIESSVKAQILTDIRLMTVTVTHSDPEVTAQLSDAVNRALIRFGNEKKEFDEIRLLSETDTERVVIGSRLKNALLLGAFLGGILAFFLLWLLETLDDAVYVPEDAERRYGLPVVEVRCREGQKLPEALAEDYRRDREMAETAGVLPEFDPEEAAKISADAAPQGIFLKLEYASGRGTMTEHRLSELKKQGITVKGIILTGADAGFLAKYYRLDAGKNGGKRHE